MIDKKIPPHKEAAFKDICEKYKGNAAKQQCLRLLAALKLFKLNTYEASRGLSVYHPPARMMQLRRQGNQIDTAWEVIEDENGNKHRVGCYVLQHQTLEGV
jgi:hypothetical protein